MVLRMFCTCVWICYSFNLAACLAVASEMAVCFSTVLFIRWLVGLGPKFLDRGS